MDETPTIFFDCQTNGSSAATSQIIEAAWIYYPDGILGKSLLTCRFVKLQKDQILPPRVSRLTGIDENSLKNGISEKALFKELIAIIKTNSQNLRWVVHYESFERAYLLRLLNKYTKEEMTTLPGTVSCTHKLAKIRYPHLPSYSIHAVSGYLGHSIEKLKRASDHVLATKFIWDQIHSHSGGGTEEIPISKMPGKNYISLIDKSIRMSWPEHPGVYRMYSKNRQLLYIGKATNLKSRLNSYFRGQKTKGGRLNELLTQVDEVTYIETESSNEASILECLLIDQLQPKYNIALVSDGQSPKAVCNKNFPFLNLSDHCQLVTLPSSSLTGLTKLYSQKETENSLFEYFSEKRIVTQLGKLAKDVFGTARLPSQFQMRLNRIFGEYWALVQRFDVREYISKDMDWDELFEIDPNAYIRETLHHLLLRSALELQKSKWIKRLMDCQISFGIRENLTLRVGVSTKENLVYLENSQSSLSFHLSGLKQDFTMNRSAFNKLNVILSEVKRQLKSGNSVEVKLCSGRELQKEELSTWLLNI